MNKVEIHFRLDAHSKRKYGECTLHSRFNINKIKWNKRNNIRIIKWNEKIKTINKYVNINECNEK